MQELKNSSLSKRKDKLRESIIKSKNKQIYKGQILSKKQKQQILRYIISDYAYNLSIYLQKKAIKYTSQIGIQGSSWNILHYASKSNSVQCIQHILKDQYHQQIQQFQKLKNTKTIQGYTPLMISIIYQSNQALNILLKLGGADLHITDYKNMNAYDLAINYQNQTAIQMLMKYQSDYKKSRKIIKNRLQQPMTFIKKQQTICQKGLKSLFNCLTFGFLYKQQTNQQSQMKSNILKLSPSSFNKFQSLLQQVRISSSPTLQSQYDIIWKDIRVIIKNQSYPLFQNYNPFDISQKNIVIKNNLIIFQCLSQHPWLVRKIIQLDRSSKNSQYFFHLYINYQYKKFIINSQIPFIKDRNQPMFIQNHNQMWPSLLQKGLALAHKGYFDLQQINPFQIIQQLTGYPTFQIDLNSYQNYQIFKLLQQINRKGYFFLLQGKQGSNLSSQPTKKQCFSLLNFYEKVDKKLILINCPFVNEIWKAKQKYQPYALKLIKSHINNHNQMSVWIQQDKLKSYFSKLIISTILPNYQRNSIKIKLKNCLFFTFKIKKQRQQNIILQLINLQNKKCIQPNQIQIYSNEGKKKINTTKGIDKQKYSSGIFNIQNKPGEYICYLDLNQQNDEQYSQQTMPDTLQSQIDKKLQSHLLIMYSIDNIQPVYLDQTLGPIEFLQCIKTYLIKNWNQQEKYRVQILQNYALVILIENKQYKKIYAQLQIDKNDLIQGVYKDSKSIQLVKQDGLHYNSKFFYYSVIQNVNKYQLIQKNSNHKNKDKQKLLDLKMTKYNQITFRCQ